MSQVLEMTDFRQHRPDGFHDHACIPGAAWANLQVGRVAPFTMKSAIGQNDHRVSKPSHQGPEGGIRDISLIALPGSDEPQMIEHDAHFGAYNPAMVRQAFGPQWLGATAFA